MGMPIIWLPAQVSDRVRVCLPFSLSASWSDLISAALSPRSPIFSPTLWTLLLNFFDNFFFVFVIVVSVQSSYLISLCNFFSHREFTLVLLKPVILLLQPLVLGLSLHITTASSIL